MNLLLNVSYTFAGRSQILSCADFKQTPRFPMVSPRSAPSDGLVSSVTDLLYLLCVPVKKEI
jgi:hypothetical protein